MESVMLGIGLASRVPTGYAEAVEGGALAGRQRGPVVLPGCERGQGFELVGGTDTDEHVARPMALAPAADWW